MRLAQSSHASAIIIAIVKTFVTTKFHVSIYPESWKTSAGSPKFSILCAIATNAYTAGPSRNNSSANTCSKHSACSVHFLECPRRRRKSQTGIIRRYIVAHAYPAPIARSDISCSVIVPVSPSSYASAEARGTHYICVYYVASAHVQSPFMKRVRR